ncbi:MAG: hypothetical protein CVT49_07075 [candidate division Zixibacteria bacterium HGW-Zixibacteria-1]|nr:MAG: hypothetical protein CVT49_07075 [candidate division Zixibacteria bacterium HGW-Zixibacteria-1]
MIRGRTGIFNKSCAMLILGLAFVIACGCNPKVMHSMMAPETGKVQVWVIDLGMDTLSADTSFAFTQLKKEFTSELANEQYYREYLDQVGEELGTLGHQIAGGPVAEGTILIKPGAQKRYTVTVGSNYDQRLIIWNRMEQQEAPGEDKRSNPHSHEIRPTDYVKPVYHNSDAVRDVYIEITGADGKLLGAIDITGGKVKPEFVAEVLDRLIRDGKW